VPNKSIYLTLYKRLYITLRLYYKLYDANMPTKPTIGYTLLCVSQSALAYVRNMHETFVADVHALCVLTQLLVDEWR
jgi:hypothetical protein